ncbi:hypothetical protein IJ670_01160 [bacterium]|nr:hypothetical protein [bacterium]
MAVSITDRVVSSISYFTFGIFSLVWIIFANLTRRSITPFLNFNLYQAIFISVALACFSLIYQIGINLLSIIPFVGKMVVAFDIFFNSTPIYYGFTLSSLIIALLLSYLIIMSLIGIRPYIPVISDIINGTFGG